MYATTLRHYDPQLCRFVSMDTYHGTYMDTMSQNLYIYAQNNPLCYFDRTGQDYERYRPWGDRKSDKDACWYWQENYAHEDYAGDICHFAYLWEVSELISNNMQFTDYQESSAEEPPNDQEWILYSDRMYAYSVAYYNSALGMGLSSIGQCSSISNLLKTVDFTQLNSSDLNPFNSEKPFVGDYTMDSWAELKDMGYISDEFYEWLTVRGSRIFEGGYPYHPEGKYFSTNFFCGPFALMAALTKEWANSHSQPGSKNPTLNPRPSPGDIEASDIREMVEDGELVHSLSIRKIYDFDRYVKSHYKGTWFEAQQSYFLDYVSAGGKTYSDACIYARDEKKCNGVDFYELAERSTSLYIHGIAYTYKLEKSGKNRIRAEEINHIMWSTRLGTPFVLTENGFETIQCNQTEWEQEKEWEHANKAYKEMFCP